MPKLSLFEVYAAGAATVFTGRFVQQRYQSHRACRHMTVKSPWLEDNAAFIALGAAGWALTWPASLPLAGVDQLLRLLARR